jgi:hypothetical protein
MLHVHINSIAECQATHKVEGVGQNRRTHSRDTTYSSHYHVTSHSHHHRKVRCWWLCDYTWVTVRRFSISTGDERNWDVRLTFVLIALNYTSESVIEWWNSATERRSDVSVNEPLQSTADFYFSPFLSSFLSSYCSCLFLVPLFFSLSFSSFLFLISSTYSFMHSFFIHSSIHTSNYPTICPSTH